MPEIILPPIPLLVLTSWLPPSPRKVIPLLQDDFFYMIIGLKKRTTAFHEMEAVVPGITQKEVLLFDKLACIEYVFAAQL